MKRDKTESSQPLILHFLLLTAPLFLSTTTPWSGYRFYEQLRLQSLRVLPIPHITIYLDATPETCMQRITTRARVREERK